ncbi:hypothetical protein CXG81DRAFT_16667 [Caulochytrium protostelioides]|uniref:Uncharacterized protein n=1 Tax=Caulochytrium protostelioides TaxID=1555241 RepID=A0A4P9WXH5_9FUNG|nr:hypothetical protein CAUPRSCDRAFT_11112 [Caulochytrium protostelioides]RKP03833.1 hypothetical protein CXG81DRAFT_16667 [Caulochytrium protostelioides]|eukprot:RKP03833.1 hypothetical protein CXG81DRAFT_16667 [Caulochytrium protostelioides]
MQMFVRAGKALLPILFLTYLMFMVVTAVPTGQTDAQSSTHLQSGSTMPEPSHWAAYAPVNHVLPDANAATVVSPIFEYPSKDRPGSGLSSKKRKFDHQSNAESSDSLASELAREQHYRTSWLAAFKEIYAAKNKWLYEKPYKFDSLMKFLYHPLRASLKPARRGRTVPLTVLYGIWIRRQINDNILVRLQPEIANGKTDDTNQLAQLKTDYGLFVDYTSMLEATWRLWKDALSEAELRRLNKDVMHKGVILLFLHCYRNQHPELNPMNEAHADFFALFNNLQNELCEVHGVALDVTPNDPPNDHWIVLQQRMQHHAESMAQHLSSFSELIEIPDKTSTKDVLENDAAKKNFRKHAGNFSDLLASKQDFSQKNALIVSQKLLFRIFDWKIRLGDHRSNVDEILRLVDSLRRWTSNLGNGMDISIFKELATTLETDFGPSWTEITKKQSVITFLDQHTAFKQFLETIEARLEDVGGCLPIRAAHFPLNSETFNQPQIEWRIKPDTSPSASPAVDLSASEITASGFELASGTIPNDQLHHSRNAESDAVPLHVPPGVPPHHSGGPIAPAPDARPHDGIPRNVWRDVIFQNAAAKRPI